MIMEGEREKEIVQGGRTMDPVTLSEHNTRHLLLLPPPPPPPPLLLLHHLLLLLSLHEIILEDRRKI